MTPPDPLPVSRVQSENEAQPTYDGNSTTKNHQFMKERNSATAMFSATQLFGNDAF